jgi:PAS domain S-box-containing protein
VGLGAALAIFLGASFAAYDLSQGAARAAREARESLETLASIKEVLTSVIDAETNQRGYLLTGDARYLDPYRAQAPEVMARLDSLRAALADRPREIETLEKLREAVRDKVQELAQTLATSRSAGMDAARARVSIEAGRVQMDKIRSLVQDIADHELATLNERNVTARVKLETARRVVFGGVLIDLFVLLGISLVTHREIRTRERAEDAVEAANTQSQEVLDASTQVSIIATDLRGLITLFNRGAEAMLGWKARDMVGRTNLLTLHLASELEARGAQLAAHTREQPQGFEVLTAPLRLGIPPEQDWTYVGKDGRLLSVTLSLTPKQDRRGALSGYLAIARDVSEQRRVNRRQAVQHAATQALGESVTFEDAIPRALAAIGQTLGSDVLGFWTVDRATRTLRPTSFWCRSEAFESFALASRSMTFALDQGLPGRVWAGESTVWVTDLGLEPLIDRLAPARAVGLRSAFACPVALGGDVLAVLEVFSATAQEADASILDLLSGIGTQIAQFMERDAADRARRAGDERTKAIIENMLEGLIVVDHDSLIVSVNRAAERMFGYESWELVGQHLGMVVPAPGTKAQADVFLKEARLRALGRITEWKGRHKSGEIFPFELSLYEFHTPEGRLFAGHVRDISERTRLDRMKKEFVANVSHELRTPLTSIRGSLTLLSAGALGDLPDEAKDVVAIAERNTLRLITLINDILDLERLESGQLEIHIAPTSLRAVADRSLDSVRGFAEDQGVLVSVAVPEIEVLGDGDRLVQVLVNLLSNAVKFSERGGSVQIGAVLKDQAIELQVVDHGRGIPESALPHLFQRFHQVEASDARKKGGTGLGLAICKVIIEQHGGEIGVDSEPGRGSRFWFRIPTVKTEGAVLPDLPLAALFPGREPHPPAAVPAPDVLLDTLRQGTPEPGDSDVLLVDDDQALLGVLARQFLSSGIGVRVASTAREAIAKARTTAPALIVLDLGLPEGSGFEVVATLREDDALQNTPLLVYTGRDLGSEDRRRLRLGRTRFLTKSKATDEEFHRAALILLGRDEPPGERA